MAELRRTGEPLPAGPVLAERAHAKVNLTLRVVGRRADGYHDLDSLVCFAAVADRVTLRPAPLLALSVRGPTAAQAGADNDNLVLKAAREISARIGDLTLGRFGLVKHLPARAGLGGGSADAAAALRLIARANGLKSGDPRLYEAARATGADVPVCLEPQPRFMRGTGDVLSDPVTMPRLPAVLAHPSVALATKDVFAALALSERRASAEATPSKFADRANLLDFLTQHPNDLEAPAIKLAPAVATLLAELRAQPGCQLARMSGSGSACFAIFASRGAARAAAKHLAAGHPNWWIRTTEIAATAA